MQTSPLQLAAIRREVFPVQILNRPNPYDFVVSEDTILRRRRNTINSPLNRMPFEIITMIFLCATSSCPSPTNHFDCWDVRRAKTTRNDPEDVFFSVTLAAVCSLWRDVALSTPRLWTYFEYPEALWKKKPDCRYLLPVYLRNSKHLPVHLCLNFPDESIQATTVDNKSYLWHPSHDRDLVCNSGRIRSLLLQNPPPCWIAQFKRMPFLVDLSIDWKSTTLYFRDRLPLHRCHSLSHFSLHKSGRNRIIYQTPPTLTILDLSNIPIDICVKVMLRCPNLVEVYIRNQREEEEYVELDKLKEIWFAEPVVFQHLRTFLWDMCTSHEDSHWADVFCDNLSTPVLETLGLMETCERRMVDFVYGETRFINRIPKTLNRFEIWEVSEINVEALGVLMNQQSSVEHFAAVNCDADVLTKVFKVLGTSTSGKGGVVKFPMPLLKSFVMSTTQFAIDEFDEFTRFGPSDVECLVRLVEQRLGKRGAGLRVEIEGFAVDWTPSAQRRLRALVRRGAKLELLEDGEPVHWLKID